MGEIKQNSTNKCIPSVSVKCFEEEEDSERVLLSERWMRADFSDVGH